MIKERKNYVLKDFHFLKKFEEKMMSEKSRKNKKNQDVLKEKHEMISTRILVNAY